MIKSYLLAQTGSSAFCDQWSACMDCAKVQTNLVYAVRRHDNTRASVPRSSPRFVWTVISPCTLLLGLTDVGDAGAGQGWQSLEVENERLREELDGLRQRAVTTPQHELRAKNERLVSQLRELEKGDKTRAQLGYEVAELKQQLDQLRRANGKNSTAALRRQVKVRKHACSSTSCC